MFYINIYVTLNIDRTNMGIAFIWLLLEFYYILFVMNYNLITLNKPLKSCCYLKKNSKKKKKNIKFCKAKCGLKMTFYIGIKFYFVKASSYIFLVQK